MPAATAARSYQVPAAPAQQGGGVRRFPTAAQPEIMRAAEKDDQYASFVYDACRDAFRHLFGLLLLLLYYLGLQFFPHYFYPSVLLLLRIRVRKLETVVDVNSQTLPESYSFQTKLLGQILYYVLTTGSGQQTLGEEYCDIIQVAGPYGLPPTPARRALFVVYQTAVPYIAERISSRVASRGITLSDSLSMLPLAREFLQVVLRTNLMFFYFEGLYYHISKRAAGIRYLFIGKQVNQRPRYQILGVFLLIQLCIIAAECLRCTNLSSISSSVHQTSLGTHQASAGRGIPVLNEGGNLVTGDSNMGFSDSKPTSEVIFQFDQGIAIPFL
ncbi:hypothetical protein RHMOL_Rhmol03G0038900 [Rhododendron molle]|uniref:Uncharacterized protein n=1 Tax=Rhododendron molle TaxID=49168 RepID=A0ACC0PBC8_RHOML|nr:hypothetical protein RHMOL_Rhmol03G0038900 [Rhododendron molle]